MNPSRSRACCMISIALYTLAAQAQPPTGARLLISGPFVAYGDTYNEIHQFDLQTQARTTLRSFPSHPGPIAMGPDGALYVAIDAEERIYKLNPLTGDTVEILDIPLVPLSNFAEIAVKPNGNLLVVREDYGNGQVDEYAPDGTHLSLWLGTTYIIRGIKLTPSGKVALLCCGHPGYEPNELVEYDLDGSNPRVLIESSMGVQMYSFQFVSAIEVLVMDRGPNPDLSESKIKRYDLTTTPATYLGDLITPPPSIPLGIARNSQDGSIYGAGPHLGGDGCVFGWGSDGTPLNGGGPFPTCYGPGPLYAGAVLVVNDCGTLVDHNGNFVSDDCDPITVLIDIKPGSRTNPIRLDSHRMVVVAILTTPDFDAATVDAETVRFAGASVAERSNGRGLLAKFRDVDHDGDADLVLNFRTDDLDLATDATSATLTGETYDGQAFEGTDSVRIVP